MLRVKELRHAHGLTQVELAQRLSITQTAVSQWEKGRTMPDISQLTQMSKIFDVSINYILGETDDPASPRLSNDPRLDEIEFAAYSGPKKDLMDRVVDIDEDLANDLLNIIKRVDQYKKK